MFLREAPDLDFDVNAYQEAERRAEREVGRCIRSRRGTVDSGGWVRAVERSCRPGRWRGGGTSGDAPGKGGPVLTGGRLGFLRLTEEIERALIRTATAGEVENRRQASKQELRESKNIFAHGVRGARRVLGGWLQK